MIDLSGLSINIGASSKEEAEAQLDAALEKVKAHVVDHLEKRERTKRRVSFGH